MKTIAVLFLLVTALSCQKNQTDDKPVEYRITGKWELRKSEGGIAGTINYQQGNGNLFEFKTNGTYNIIVNGTVHETGAYTVHPSITPGQWILKMVNPSSVTTISIRVNEQELVFLKLSDCCDYPDLTYARMTY
jgi:hypothetical protein